MQTIPLANNALTTLDTMRGMIGLTGDDEQRDSVLNALINAASAWVETMIGRKLGKATYTQRYDAAGEQELVLTQWPILSVEYVKDIESGTEIDRDSYDFETLGSIGVLYKDSGWPFRSYRGGLAYDPIAIRRCLEVRYTAGYTLPKDATEDVPVTLPYDLQSIVWGIVQQEFGLMKNGAQGLSAFSISDVSWTFDKTPRESWLAVIQRYARV